MLAFSSWRQVVDVGVGPRLRVQGEAAAILDELRDGAGGIVQIAEDARLRRAIVDARRILALRQALTAEVALHHDPLAMARRARLLVGRRSLLAEVVALFGMEVAVVVGTGHHAGATADAHVRVDVDDAVFGVMAGSGGAYFNARRVAAVVAQYRQQDLPRRRVVPFFAFEQPGEEYAGRGSVLRLA